MASHSHFDRFSFMETEFGLPQYIGDYLDESEIFDPYKLNTEAQYAENDYNLLSPMLDKSLENFINYTFYNQEANPVYKKPTWGSIRASIHRWIPLERPRPTSDHAEIWGKICLDKVPNTNRIRTILNKTNQDTLDKAPVIQSFLKGWINHTTEPSNQINLSPSTYQYGEMLITFHLMVLCLNARTKEEITAMKKVISCKNDRSEDDEHHTFVMDDPNFGRIYIFKDYFYIPKIKLFGHRNLCLMIKDTLLGRFNSLISMSNRLDGKFIKSDRDQLEELYRLGDLCLHKHKIEGYNVIKLIESLCMDRIAATAKTLNAPSSQNSESI